MAKDDYAHWLSDDQYKKAVFHFNSQVTNILQNTYSMHGYSDFAVGVAKEITELAEQFGKVVRGKDVPIVSKRKRNK